MLDVHARFIRYLESSRNLDRELEALPDATTSWPSASGSTGG